MTWATPKVEINFRTSLANADNWIDVTSRVLGTIQIDRGRQSELDQYGASSCKFTLINVDREFDFTYTAGAHYGQLLPRTEVRVTCLFSAVTYNLWRGFIQGWPQGYDNEAQMATVEIQAVDRFDLLAQSNWIGGPATTYLKYLNPPFWVRSVFESGVDTDSDPTKIITSITTEDGSKEIRYYKNAWANATGGNAIQSDIRDKAVTVIYNQGSGSGATSGHAYSDFINTNLLTVGTNFSFGGWFRTRTPAEQPQVSGVAGMVSLGGFFRPGGIQFNWQWTGLPFDVTSRLFVNVRHWTGGTVGATINYDANLADDQWHHIIVTNTSNDFRLYVDGTLVKSTTAFGTNTLDDSAVFALANTSGGGLDVWNGYAYDIFGFSRTLTPTEISSLYQAGINLPGQLSGARLQTLLNLFGMASIPQSVSVGQTLMSDVNIDGGSLLDSLQSIAKAESGRLYVDADGTLVFRSRLDNLTQTRSTSVQAIFGDFGSSSNIRYLEASPTLDVQYMFNQINTSIEGGTSYQVNDVASQIAYGVRSMDNTGLALANENDAISMAQWNVVKYGTPKARLPYMRFSPRTSTAAMTAALSLNLADRINIFRKPQNVGASPWAYDALIEGLSHRIDLSNLSWDTTYNLTQTDIISGYMKLGDATDGHLDAAKLAG